MDSVLDQMASELRAVLVEHGLDPKNPPQGGPPSARAFQEYQERGGSQFTDAEVMASALVKRVGEL